MVSFSCEVCNDVVKKPKLDSHKGQCRGAYFTCIDCNTTFNNGEYKSHTSCISEAQKYQGALYKPEKGKGKKRKQPETPAAGEKKKADEPTDVPMAEATVEPVAEKNEEEEKEATKEEKKRSSKVKKDKKKTEKAKQAETLAATNNTTGDKEADKPADVPSAETAVEPVAPKKKKSATEEKKEDTTKEKKKSSSKAKKDKKRAEGETPTATNTTEKKEIDEPTEATIEEKQSQLLSERVAKARAREPERPLTKDERSQLKSEIIAADAKKEQREMRTATVQARMDALITLPPKSVIKSAAATADPKVKKDLVATNTSEGGEKSDEPADMKKSKRKRSKEHKHDGESTEANGSSPAKKSKSKSNKPIISDLFKSSGSVSLEAVLAKVEEERGADAREKFFSSLKLRMESGSVILSFDE